MSQKIDPDSVHLGDIASAFYSEYFPVAKADQPVSCILPEAKLPNLTSAPLLSLNEACSFTFPGVIPLPPVYNPPQIKFLACETLSAETNITTCPAAKNTNLQLIATGPVPPEEKDGSASCSLTLAGNICVDACEDFTATTAVNFPYAMRGSSMVLNPRSIPNCGVDLVANLALDVCEDFKVTGGIAVKGAAKGGVKVTPYPKPECGIDINGLINVDACETFDATANIRVYGPKVVQRSAWSVTKTSTPNCGFELNGDVVIKACAEFDVDGQMTIDGLPGVVQKIAPLKGTARKAPNCGLTLSGGVFINACKDFEVTGAMSITGKGVSGTITPNVKKAPNCGINFGGGVVIDVCDEIYAGGSVSVSGRGLSGGISLVKTDKCTLSLSGGISLDGGCANGIETGGNAQTSGNAVSGGYYLKPSSDGCGVSLEGGIDVNACTDTEISTAGGAPHNIELDIGGAKSNIAMQSNMEVTSTGCGIHIAHWISPGDPNTASAGGGIGTSGGGIIDHVNPFGGSGGICGATNPFLSHGGIGSTAPPCGSSAQGYEYTYIVNPPGTQKLAVDEDILAKTSKNTNYQDITTCVNGESKTIRVAVL